MMNEKIKKNWIVRFGKTEIIRAMSRMSPVSATKVLFRLSQGFSLDLNHPKTFNEKLQFLKLNQYYNNELVTQVVDKYEVREYIEKKGMGNLLNELVGAGVYDSADDIDFDSLPDSFVLKCTHDSGSVIVCKSKKEFDWNIAKKRITKSLKKDYWLDNCEVQYKYVKKRIIAERYLQAEGGLIDYKFYCFNGEPRFLYCTFPLEDEMYQMRFYDLNWNRLDFQRKDTMDLKYDIQKPEKLDEMIEISKKLSQDFPFARIDLYDVDGKVYFSEITLIPTGGLAKYDKPGVDEKLGKLLQL